MMTRSSEPVFADFLALVPGAPGWSVDWAGIWELLPYLEALDRCPQDPRHHGEGDVGTHTRMVVECLVADPEWRGLEDEARTAVFWAAVLHDIGKPKTTRPEDDGRITSRGHSRRGALMAREILWHAGAPFAWREGLCGLIAYHQLPFWLIERDNPARMAIETSWRCRPDHLCLHAAADARGRICDDKQSILDNVALARLTFEEAGCLTAPFPFGNAASRVEYFAREDRDPYYVPHAEFRCRATVMVGLPGVGKDTWIAANRPDLPVVSLDDLRSELAIRPRDNQGRVVQAARERAREYLRAGQDFVWNATNISRQMRERTLTILRDYDAEIEIVYLEYGADRVQHQNARRPDAVPPYYIGSLAAKMEPPDETEAHRVIRVVESGEAD